MDFASFQNKHSDERCFILGNSPTLADESLSLLENERVFICNKGYKAVDIGLKSYDYYVLSDIGVAELNQDKILEVVDKPKFFSSAIVNREEIKKLTKSPHVKFVRNAGLLGAFPSSYSDGWGKVCTVVLDAAILAYFMGFKEIYLLGVNLDYSGDNTHFYEDDTREIRLRDAIPTRIKDVLKNMSTIKAHFDKNNVRFANCSAGWKHTNTVPHILLQNVIKNNKL